VSDIAGKTPARDREAQLAEHYAYCESLVRQNDRDRWLASLFALADARRHLHALAAFTIEIARVRDVASDPAPGEIRMQWWIDAIEGEARGDVRGHPVADALIDTIRRFRLPRRALTDHVEARRFDLYDDPMSDMSALETWCGHVFSVPMRLASIILADGQEPGGAAGAGYAGVALGIATQLHLFAHHAAQGRLFVPVDLLERHGLTPGAALTRPAPGGLVAALAEMRALARRRLAEARAELSRVAPAARPAFLPIATVPLVLDRLDSTQNPYAPIASIPQWRRQWALWRMARQIG
jgi:phytoene synthase